MREWRSFLLTLLRHHINKKFVRVDLHVAVTTAHYNFDSVECGVGVIIPSNKLELAIFFR